MFHSVSLLSQAPLARGSCALPSVLFNNVVITTFIEMVEMVEILDGRLGKRSVERVRYVINNLLHLVILKYGDISIVLCISTRLRQVTILSLLLKYVIVKARKRGNYAANSIPRKLPIGNSTGYFTRYIEIVREICNSTARVK